LKKTNLLVAFGILIVLGLFFYIKIHERDADVKTSKADFQSLVDFAQSHSNLREFLRYASTSMYTELTVQPPPPANLKAKSADGLPSPEWTDWMSKNSKTMSLNKMDDVLKVVDKVQKGFLTIADPKDNPTRYDRRFLQLRYDGDNITEVTPRSL